MTPVPSLMVLVASAGLAVHPHGGLDFLESEGRANGGVAVASRNVPERLRKNDRLARSSQSLATVGGMCIAETPSMTSKHAYKSVFSLSLSALAAWTLVGAHAVAAVPGQNPGDPISQPNPLESPETADYGPDYFDGFEVTEPFVDSIVEGTGKYLVSYESCGYDDCLVITVGNSPGPADGYPYLEVYTLVPVSCSSTSSSSVVSYTISPDACFGDYAVLMRADVSIDGSMSGGTFGSLYLTDLHLLSFAQTSAPEDPSPLGPSAGSMPPHGTLQYAGTNELYSYLFDSGAGIFLTRTFDATGERLGELYTSWTNEDAILYTGGSTAPVGSHEYVCEQVRDLQDEDNDDWLALKQHLGDIAEGLAGPFGGLTLNAGASAGPATFGAEYNFSSAVDGSGKFGDGLNGLIHHLRAQQIKRDFGTCMAKAREIEALLEADEDPLVSEGSTTSGGPACATVAKCVSSGGEEDDDDHTDEEDDDSDETITVWGCVPVLICI